MSIAIVELVSKGTADEQLCGKNNTKINEVFKHLMYFTALHMKIPISGHIIRYE